MERQQSIQVRMLSLVSCVLLLTVLILANVVFARTNLRLDLTEEKMYTLDDGSRAVLAQLQDPCTVQVFWHGVPTAHEGTRRYVDALLDEMASASDGQFQVTWVDMSGEDGAKLATQLEVPEYVFPAIEGDEYRESRGHMSLVLSMGDQTPTVLDRLAEIRDQLEYSIVADIQKRTRLTPPVIALVTDLSGDPDFQMLGQTLKASLGAGVRTGMTLGDPVPADVQVLILAAPKDLSTRAIYHFEQYLLAGGRGIVLLDPVDVMVAQGQATYRDSGMKEWLEHLGVQLDSGIVEDFERPGRMLAGGGVVPYPAWPVAVPPEDSQSVLVRSMRPLVLRWPGGFRIDADRQLEMARTVTTLLTTSERAYRRPDVIGLMRDVDTEAGKTLETVPLAVLVEGGATSFWKGKALPTSQAPSEGESEEGHEGDAEGSPDGERGPEGPDAPVEDREGHLDDGTLRLLVLGDADLVRDLWVPTAQAPRAIHILSSLNGGVQGGFSLLLNASDWMTGSETLLTLRARSDKPRTLQKLEASDRRLVEWLNILALPLLMLLVGIVVWIVRGNN